jgi:hypothetical protein
MGTKPEVEAATAALAASVDGTTWADASATAAHCRRRGRNRVLLADRPVLKDLFGDQFVHTRVATRPQE